MSHGPRCQTATLRLQGVKNVSITVLSGHNVLMPLLTQKKHSVPKKKHSGLPKQRKQTAQQCNVFIVLNGMTKSLRNSELLNKLNAIIKLKRPRRSTPHSVSYHWKSLLMSEALRLHILLNPKSLFFQTTRQQ